MRRWDRRRLIGLGVVIGAVVVALLVVLIALGVLVLPAQPAAQVTVSSVHWTLVQGSTGHGFGWFGPSEFNYTYPAYPVEVPPGHTFVVVWTFSNHDLSSHSIVSISAASPFRFVSSQPSIVPPLNVPAGEDSGLLDLTIQAPNDGGATFSLALTVTIT